MATSSTRPTVTPRLTRSTAAFSPLLTFLVSAAGEINEKYVHLLYERAKEVKNFQAVPYSLGSGRLPAVQQYLASLPQTVIYDEEELYSLSLKTQPSLWIDPSRCAIVPPGGSPVLTPALSDVRLAVIEPSRTASPFPIPTAREQRSQRGTSRTRTSARPHDRCCGVDVVPAVLQ